MEESTSSIVIRKTGHILNVCLKLCIIVVIAFPFYWMVSTSLKDYTEALQFPPTLFPKTVHWENYTHVFEIVPIGLYFRNSVVVSLLVLVLQYLIIVPAAYSFARHEYFGKNLFFGIVLLGLMIPQQITFVNHDLQRDIQDTAGGNRSPQVIGNPSNVAYHYGRECGIGNSHPSGLHVCQQENQKFLCLFGH